MTTPRSRTGGRDEPPPRRPSGPRGESRAGSSARRTNTDSADERPSRPRQRPRESERATDGAALDAAQAAQAASRVLLDLTGRESEGVTGLQRQDDGWLVGIEIVETHRIPNTTDILAMYEVELDRRGELMGYRRTERYARGRGDAE